MRGSRKRGLTLNYANGIILLVTGLELQKRRRVLGLTQTELAEQLGVHWSTVARWEQGVRKISQPVARLVMLLNQPTGKKGRR